MPKNNNENKKFAWLSLKFIGLLIPIITFVCGAVYFVDDRYYKSAEASSLTTKIYETTRSDLDKTEILLAGQLQQHSIKQDTRYLDNLYKRKELYKRLMEKDPDDESLKEEYHIILEDIQHIRGELTKTRSIN